MCENLLRARNVFFMNQEKRFIYLSSHSTSLVEKAERSEASEADPKGSDCYDKFSDMQTCMAQYPDLYGKDDDDDGDGGPAPPGKGDPPAPAGGQPAPAPAGETKP
ncbi:hypothetical protein MSG28_007207 [Choristoneura fumiferana]|uniref:Uncharacterized protein n=1 Tax=Choristoneura fumiferana TaxID=7141 RepID=A0ACC0JN02_CHOFU|nr:hypothetical protein MSG28_007207 [Choristoneura fumiferana]